jgi:hypothetical protein
VLREKVLSKYCENNFYKQYHVHQCDHTLLRENFDLRAEIKAQKALMQPIKGLSFQESVGHLIDSEISAKFTCFCFRKMALACTNAGLL